MNRLVFTADPDLTLRVASGHPVERGGPPPVVGDPAPDDTPQDIRHDPRVTEPDR